MGYENMGKVKKEELIDMYINKNMTLTQIGDFYGISATAVCKHVKKHNIRYKKTSGRAIYWNNIWNENNEDFIYLMGFIYADGCIAKNGNSFTLRLSIADTDINHLIKISKIIQEDMKINRYNTHDGSQNKCMFQINGQDVLDIVSKYGIIPRKSYNWVEPQVPQNLLPSFLRGWFDGDGCAHVDNNRYLRLSVVGNNEAISYYIRSLKNLGYKGNVYKRNYNTTYSFLQIGNVNDCKSFYDLINGSLRLERKWSKIENVLKIRNVL